MLAQSSTQQEYEPYGKYKIPVVATNGEETKTTNIYLDEPLRSIGDKQDYIDFEANTITRKIGSLDLATISNWTISTKNPSIHYYTISNMFNDTANILAEKYVFDLKNQPTASKLIDGNMTSYTNKIYIASGNEILPSGKIFYELSTPIVNNIELPDIKTLNGKTTLSTNTAVKPSFSGNY